MLIYRILARLPFPILYGAAYLLYLLLYYVAGYRKDVVNQNLRQAFPEKSESEITVLAKNFYRHLARLGLEIVKSADMTERDFMERVTLRHPELIEQYSEGGKQSVIVLTLHQGNWEWMLHGASLNLGIPIDPVYKPLHSRGWDDFAQDMRSKFGSEPIPMAQASGNILKNRRRFRLFVMVADQAPIEKETTYWLDYLNKEAAFYVGGEKIALITGFPVLFAQCHTLGPGRYEIEFKEIAKPPYDKSGHDILERYVTMAEAAIREQPETFLWSNRRWKRDRAAEEAAAAAQPSQDGEGA